MLITVTVSIVSNSDSNKETITQISVGSQSGAYAFILSPIQLTTIETISTIKVYKYEM